MTAPNRIRLGIVGLGLITQSRHLPNLARLTDRFEIVRVCDLSAEVARGIAPDIGPDVAWSTRDEDVIGDPSVDAVMICTPGAHSALARRALESGKHVFAEKPYAYSPRTAKVDAAFAAANGLVLQVGYMKMAEPAVAEARDLLGRIGPVRLVRATVLHPSDENQTSDVPIRRGCDVGADALSEATVSNHDEVASAIAERGGSIDATLVRNVLFGSVCHDVALLRELFPDRHFDVESAVSDGAAPPRLQLTGRIDGSVTWSISWNWLPDFPAYREWVEIYGDRGGLRIDLPAPYGGEPSATMHATLLGETGSEELTVRPGAPDAFQRELAEFAESIETGAPVRADATGASADAEILLAAAALVGVD